jgi:hypothetical protein
VFNRFRIYREAAFPRFRAIPHCFMALPKSADYLTEEEPTIHHYPN